MKDKRVSARESHNFIEERDRDEEFDIKRKQHNGCSDTHSMELMEKVQEAINNDLWWSMTKLVEELEVRHWLKRQIVKEDICYRTHSLRKSQFMSAATKKIRYEKAAALLKCMKHPPVLDILIYFSAEMNFSPRK